MAHLESYFPQWHTAGLTIKYWHVINGQFYWRIIICALWEVSVTWDGIRSWREFLSEEENLGSRQEEDPWQMLLNWMMTGWMQGLLKLRISATEEWRHRNFEPASRQRTWRIRRRSLQLLRSVEWAVVGKVPDGWIPAEVAWWPKVVITKSSKTTAEQ